MPMFSHWAPGWQGVLDQYPYLLSLEWRLLGTATCIQSVVQAVGGLTGRRPTPLVLTVKMYGIHPPHRLQAIYHRFDQTELASARRGSPSTLPGG
jgi:hypothetical protein